MLLESSEVNFTGANVTLADRLGPSALCDLLRVGELFQVHFESVGYRLEKTGDQYARSVWDPYFASFRKRRLYTYTCTEGRLRD